MTKTEIKSPTDIVQNKIPYINLIQNRVKQKNHEYTRAELWKFFDQIPVNEC